MEYVLALDQGTTSSRAILYDRDATIRSIAQRELPQIYPRTGWVEHNPEEIWASQMSVAVEALSQANSRPRDLAALGITTAVCICMKRPFFGSLSPCGRGTG